jgi:hypothetical protein
VGTKENGLVEVILGNTESTEGSKKRISLIIICPNSMVNNERGALYRKCRKNTQGEKTRLFVFSY